MIRIGSGDFVLMHTPTSNLSMAHQWLALAQVANISNVQNANIKQLGNPARDFTAVRSFAGNVAQHSLFAPNA